MKEDTSSLHPHRRSFKVEERHIVSFWKKVNRNGPTPDQKNPHYMGLGPCWEWGGCRNKWGYGTIKIQCRDRKAHRVSWAIHFGELSTDLDVLHRCDNPSCVNPDHLWLGNDSMNRTDSVTKGRDNSPKGERNKGGGKLTEEKVAAIRNRTALGEGQRHVAKDFGVSQALVSLIHRRESWRHVA